MFTLINDARAAAGKKPIGFVNPTLYANPTMFNDIMYGSNRECTGFFFEVFVPWPLYLIAKWAFLVPFPAGCGTTGFTAQKGWDPLTGLGTPQFQKMMSVFMALK